MRLGLSCVMCCVKGRSMPSVSLQDCLELFTQEETLEGDERPVSLVSCRCLSLCCQVSFKYPASDDQAPCCVGSSAEYMCLLCSHL